MVVKSGFSESDHSKNAQPYPVDFFPYGYNDKTRLCGVQTSQAQDGHYVVTFFELRLLEDPCNPGCEGDLLRLKNVHAARGFKQTFSGKPLPKYKQRPEIASRQDLLAAAISQYQSDNLGLLKVEQVEWRLRVGGAQFSLDVTQAPDGDISCRVLRENIWGRMQYWDNPGPDGLVPWTLRKYQEESHIAWLHEMRAQQAINALWASRISCRGMN